jgi:hypothetical protein
VATTEPATSWLQTRRSHNDLLCRRDDADHPCVSVRDETSRLRRYERACPGGILRGELWVRPTRKDKIVVSRRIVDVMKDFLKIDPGVGALGMQPDRDDWQPLAQSDGPEPRPRTILGAADQYAVIARATILKRHSPAAAKQVDLQVMNRAAKQLLTLGHILLAIRAASLVGGTKQFEHRDQPAPERLSDLKEWHASNVRVCGFHWEHAERIPSDSGVILVRRINEDNITNRPCRG